MKTESCADIEQKIMKLKFEYDDLNPIDIERMEEIKNEINKLVHLLFVKSDEEGYYYFACALPVYKKTLSDRLESVKRTMNPGITLQKLMENDYKVIDNAEINQANSGYPPFMMSSLNRELLKQARSEKLEYIQKRFNDDGLMMFRSGNDYDLVNIPTDGLEEGDVDRSTNALKIALMVEAGSLDTEVMKNLYRSSLKDYYKAISKMTGVHSRDVRGFLNILNKSSTESSGRYPTEKWLPEARKLLKII